jgi:hypothetical protein
MDIGITKYTKDITAVFGIGVDVLNVARSLKTISLDLKLLAINGIVQAAKIGTNQGQSLITLSGFLSALPLQIAPELADLEELASILARKITISSIQVRRFINYSTSLENMVDKAVHAKNKSAVKEINVYSAKTLNKLKHIKSVSNLDPLLRDNIYLLAQKNLDLNLSMNEGLYESLAIIIRTRKKIERIRQNGVIANYMGSNISIESSYLTKGKKDFEALVNNIKGIVGALNEKLDQILEKLIESEKLLSKLIKSGIIK